MRVAAVVIVAEEFANEDRRRERRVSFFGAPYGEMHQPNEVALIVTVTEVWFSM